MKKSQYTFLKSTLTLLASLVLVYILFMLSLAQGMGVLHKDMFPSYIETFDAKTLSKQTNQHPVLSAFFGIQISFLKITTFI